MIHYVLELGDLRVHLVFISQIKQKHWGPKDDHKKKIPLEKWLFAFWGKWFNNEALETSK